MGLARRDAQAAAACAIGTGGGPPVVLLVPQADRPGPDPQAGLPAVRHRAGARAGHGGAIFASNHLVFSDSIFFPLVVERRITFLAKQDYFTGRGLKGRLTAGFFKGVGQLPVDRSGGSASEAALRTGLKVLGRGDCLGIYPEGTRSPDGQALPRQDRRRPDGAGGRRPGAAGRDDRHREDPAARTQDADLRHPGRASRSARRWTSRATRAWRATGSSCGRSPTRSCTS